MAYNCCLAVIVSFVDAIVCCVCTLDDCDCCPFRLWHLWLMTFRVPYIIWFVDCITVASRHLFDSQSLMAIWRIHSYGLNAFICIYGNANTVKITRDLWFSSLFYINIRSCSFEFIFSLCCASVRAREKLIDNVLVSLQWNIEKAVCAINFLYVRLNHWNLAEMLLLLFSTWFDLMILRSNVLQISRASFLFLYCDLFPCVF